MYYFNGADPVNMPINIYYNILWRRSIWNEKWEYILNIIRKFCIYRRYV